jgi:hypothetical protein
MTSSGMLRRVTLVRTGVSEERSASIIRVTRIGEVGTSVLARATRRNIPEEGVLQFLLLHAAQTDSGTHADASPMGTGCKAARA